MKQKSPPRWRRMAVPTLLAISLLLSTHCSNAQNTLQDGETLASTTIDVDRIPNQVDEKILETQPNGDAHSMNHQPMREDEVHTERYPTDDSETSDPTDEDITIKNHDEFSSADSGNQQQDASGPGYTATEAVVSDNIDEPADDDPNHRATINAQAEEERQGVTREAPPPQEAADTWEDLSSTYPPNGDRDIAEKETMHAEEDSQRIKSGSQDEIEDKNELDLSTESPNTHETKHEGSMRVMEVSIDTTIEEATERQAMDESEKENSLHHESRASEVKTEIPLDLVVGDTPESEPFAANQKEEDSESETVRIKDDTSTEMPPEEIRTEPQSIDDVSEVVDSFTDLGKDCRTEKEKNDEPVRAPCDNETPKLYCGVWGSYRLERSYADLRILQLLFQGLDLDEKNATQYLSYLASSASGNVDLPSEEDILGEEPAQESAIEGTIDDSPLRKTANTQFVEGLDDIDKFFEGIDPPDELDVAAGSSMQEVIMGQGTRIVLKRLSMAFRAIKNAFVEAKDKVVETKDNLLDRIHSDEGLHLPFDTDDVVRLLENIWDTTVRASVAAREAAKNAFEDDGVARRIWRFAVDAVRTAQSTIDDILEGDGGEAEEELQEMASKLRQTTSTADSSKSDTSMNDQIQEMIRQNAERER